VAMKHGKWIFYDPIQGKIEETQHYVMNKVKTEDELAGTGDADEIRPIGVSTGKSKSDTSTKKSIVKPKEVLEYEKRNSGKKKIKSRDGETGY
jgi:hypothetical protein